MIKVDYVCICFYMCLNATIHNYFTGYAGTFLLENRCSNISQSPERVFSSFNTVRVTDTTYWLSHCFGAVIKLVKLNFLICVSYFGSMQRKVCSTINYQFIRRSAVATYIFHHISLERNKPKQDCALGMVIMRGQLNVMHYSGVEL